MKREYAEQLVNKYMNRIYAFAMKRVNSDVDASDVAQEICLNVYKAACVKEVYAEDAFVWTIARHTLVNFYRKQARNHMNISIEENEMEVEDGRISTLEQMIIREDEAKIRKEIAYLSKIQHKIVILYYYEGKKQSEIAKLLDIPLGTVKWHLSEAKEDLKKGMVKMRNISDLKFNPIEFSVVGLSGSSGEMGAPIHFFRSALSQDIVYSIYRKPLSVEEIADAIGVSPVYVESELDFLEQYALVIRKNQKYMANILIDEPSREANESHKNLYTKVSSLIANTLFDEIMEKNYLEGSDIYMPGEDKNFAMWSLTFFLLAWVESDYFSEKITFDEVAELRADGGKNLIHATIKAADGEEYIIENKINQLCGPCWNEWDDVILWLIDGDWTGKRVTWNYGGENTVRDINLITRFYRGEILSVEDMTFLLQKHYIRKSADGFELAIVALKEGETKKQLFELTKQVKNQVMEQLNEEIEAYKNAVLKREQLPPHLEKQRKFELQNLFHSDGWFMLYAKQALVESKRLKLVEESQKDNVTEIVLLK